MPHLSGGIVSHALSSIFFNGLLYINMISYALGPERVAKYRLWSYNHVEGIWKDTCVKVQFRCVGMVGLNVGNNRLFLITSVHRGHTQTNHSADCWSYEISEVQLEDRTHRKVFEMTAAVVEQVFQVSNISSCTNIRLDAIGFDKSIFVLCKQSGISILYDLSTSCGNCYLQIPRYHAKVRVTS